MDCLYFTGIPIQFFIYVFKSKGTFVKRDWVIFQYFAQSIFTGSDSVSLPIQRVHGVDSVSLPIQQVKSGETLKQLAGYHPATNAKQRKVKI